VENATILLFYTDRYYLIKQVYPFGLDLIARYLRQHGHHVTVEYPFLPDPDPETNLLNILKRDRPEVIGLGIRNLDTCLSCEPYGDYIGNDFRTFYFLPEIRKMVDLIKTHCPEIPLIAGGGGFTISPQAILNYLGIEYGVTGEGEEPFRQFIEAFPDREKIQGISGLAYRDGGRVRVNPRTAYSFAEGAGSGIREERFRFAFETTGLPVQVKRGCNQTCSYCVEPIIERDNIVFRQMDRVIEELKVLSQGDDGVRQIFFVDTEFNLPDLAYCTRLVERIIQEGLHERFGFASQFLPKPFDSDFAGLLREAGFSIILTCDSFSDTVLKRNHTSYRRRDIQNTLELCEQNGISCTLSMIFGLPGETYATVDDSIEQMKKYKPGLLRRYEYTVGGRIYQGTRLCRMIEKGEGLEYVYGTLSEGYLAPCYFCAPESPFKLKQYIEDGLGYVIAYENRYDPAAQRSLAVAYMADQGRWWEEAASTFMGSSLPARLRIYDYFFRKLTGAGRIHEARIVSENLLAAMQQDAGGDYREESSLIQFYLNCLMQ
jgi:hypothetical protein